MDYNIEPSIYFIQFKLRMLPLESWLNLNWSKPIDFWKKNMVSLKENDKTQKEIERSLYGMVEFKFKKFK